MSPFLQFVELLKVLLSWPVVVLVLGLVFLLRFKIELVALINRIAVIQLPWGGALQTSQQIANVQADAAPSQVPATTNEAAPAAVQDAAALQALLTGEKNRAAFFEYQYLNLFLVPHTQLVLDWIAGFDRSISTREYDAWWMQRIPVPHERRAVVFALANHHLIDLSGNSTLITLTPKGREYFEWRGPLAPLLAVRPAPSAPPPSLPAETVALAVSPSPLPRDPDGPSK